MVDLMRGCPRARAVALGLATIIVARAGVSRAAQLATRLDYGASPGCPGAPEFEAVVAGRLGYDPFRKGAPERVIVRIDPAGKSLEGHLEWRDASGGWAGEQTFPSRTGNCAEIARAMGFALALQLQMMAVLGAEPRGQSAPSVRQPPPASPSSSGRATPPAQPPATTIPTTSAPPSASTPVNAPPAATSIASGPQPPDVGQPPVVAVASAESPASSSQWPRPSFALGAGGAVVLSSATSLAAGRLFGRVVWSHLAFELAGEVSAPSDTHRADGAGFSQQEILGEVAGCGVVSPWSACALAKVGELRVAGKQVDVPATPSALMVQTGLRLGFAHPLGKRFELGGHVDGMTRITQATVTLDSFPVATIPRFALVLGLDAAFLFP